MSLMTRRRMMGGSVLQEDIRLWISGEDAPKKLQNQKWIITDRTDTDSTDKTFIIGERTDTTFESFYDLQNKRYDFTSQANQAYNNWNTSSYDFGHHWKLYFDMDVRVYSGATKGRYFLDLGSIASASHSFGFSMGIGADGSNAVGVNWKLNGNNSNPGIGTLMHGYQTQKQAGEYDSVSGYYAIIDGGDGYDYLEININGVVERYNVKIYPTGYSPPWNINKFVVGGAIDSSYGLPCYIRELKMVVID